MQTFQNANYPLLDDTQLQKIENMSDRILKEVGVTLKDDPQSLAVLQRVGAQIEGQNARIDAATLREIIQRNAPSEFTWKGQHTNLQLGSGETYYAPMFGAPNIRREDDSYGQTNLKDYQDLVTLCQQSAIMGSSGFLLCIPHDVAEQKRHLAMLDAHLTHASKPIMGTVLNEQALRGVAGEIKATDFVPGECQLLHMINSTPPLTYQSNPLKCLRAAAELGQGSLVTSYMMMGATSPVTVSDSLAQGLAELLIGVALTQLYQPGVAVAGGLFATPFSMSKMLPAFGTLESHFAMLAGVQLIKRLGIVSRGDGLITSAKVHDQQANSEGIMQLSAAQLAGADLILHSAGWLENGRCVDIKKMQYDIEYLSIKA